MKSGKGMHTSGKMHTINTGKNMAGANEHADRVEHHGNGMKHGDGQVNDGKQSSVQNRHGPVGMDSMGGPCLTAKG